MSTSQDDVTAAAIEAPSVQAIPVKLAPDLPISNSGAFDIVAVVNNKDTVRVSWESLTANHIQQTGDVPASPGAVDGISAPYLTLAADGTGLYVSDGTEWRKIATYGANWDDIDTEDTRFLPVNKTITLTPTERANALTSLDLGTATTTKEGLVKIPEDPIKGVGIENGELYVRLVDPINENNIDGTPGIVYIKDFYDGYDESDADPTISPRCAVTERYVDQAINSRRVSVPFASYTQSGTVQIAEGTALTVDSENGGLLSIKTATEDENGVVRIHNIYDDSGNPIDPIATSKGYVDKLVRDSVVYTPATDDTLGMVKVYPTSSITIDPSSGAIDVKYATTDKHGTVVLSDAISDTSDYSDATVGVAATPKAVKDYVTEKTMSMALPVASASVLGGVKIGEGISVTGEGVISIQNATENHIGGVRVAQATGDTSYIVPTLKKVEEMVSIDIPQTEIATETVYGTVKLSTSRIIDTEALKIGLNNDNQLVAVPPTPAEGDSFKPSSTTVITNPLYQGLPIAATLDGDIYVDALNTLSKATSARPGLVMLSVNSATVLPTTNPGIGVDANGQLRVEQATLGDSGSSSTSEFYYYFTKKEQPTGATYSPIYYYTYTPEDTPRIPFVPAASASEPGVVILGTSTQVDGGVPVGIDSTGRLAVAVEMPEIPEIEVATAESAGIVKLGQNDVISNGLRVGVNADGQLCVARPSTDITAATFNSAGVVTLSTSTTYTADTYGVVGVDANGKLAVPAATSDGYGVVKVGGDDLDITDPTVALVGRTSEGQLAVKGVSAGVDVIQVSDDPLHVTLIPVEGSTTDYIVIMTGGAIQLNDGTIVNIEAITGEDNIVVTLTNNQTLSLKVFINSDETPTAKLTVNNSTNVLTCKPSLD